MSSVRNVHKVSVRTWRRWSPTARRVFNTLYAKMRESPELYWHPKGWASCGKHVLGRWWKTTAWNAAWIAAATVAEEE